MEIFGIGPFELVLIALITFMVLGPERIPGVMRQLGRAARQLRQMSQQITTDYGQDLQQITGEISAVQAELRNIQRDLTQVTRNLVTGAETASTPTPTPDAAATAPDTIDVLSLTPQPPLPKSKTDFRRGEAVDSPVQSTAVVDGSTAPHV